VGTWALEFNTTSDLQTRGVDSLRVKIAKNLQIVPLELAASFLQKTGNLRNTCANSDIPQALGETLFYAR
jgi:hypothetical protein